MSPSDLNKGGSGWRLEHSYGALPDFFHRATPPTPVEKSELVVFNRPLAESLGLDPKILGSPIGAEIFSGNRLPPGASPLAQAYAGHQFGGFTTLGDGRAILLGEQITPQGTRFDIQLKGPGRTPFSRGGDGRAALGPMLREYIISEAMHALGIPTTRSLAVVSTGEEVLRQDGYLPGAILTRIASSHLRVGTFQWAAASGDDDDLRALVNYTIHRHYPDLAEAENPPFALLETVIERQASLVSQWMAVGFIHGVMNTDNVSLASETIDYGPCAFMDAYDPATVFSSIDRYGRYAYGNQPQITQWNLARFAETLLPLLSADEQEAIEIATTAIKGFTGVYHRHWLAWMRRKLGLFDEEDADEALAQSLLDWMHSANADFTNTFAELDRDTDRNCKPDEAFLRWHESWQARLSRQPQPPQETARLRRSSNPSFIPRNHLVEAALEAAQHGDLDVMKRLMNILQQPYNHSLEAPEYRTPDPAGSDYKTFCGT